MPPPQHPSGKRLPLACRCDCMRGFKGNDCSIPPTPESVFQVHVVLLPTLTKSGMIPACLPDAFHVRSHSKKTSSYLCTCIRHSSAMACTSVSTRSVALLYSWPGINLALLLGSFELWRLPMVWGQLAALAEDVITGSFHGHTWTHHEMIRSAGEGADDQHGPETSSCCAHLPAAQVPGPQCHYPLRQRLQRARCAMQLLPDLAGPLLFLHMCCMLSIFLALQSRYPLHPLKALHAMLSPGPLVIPLPFLFLLPIHRHMLGRLVPLQAPLLWG